MMFSRSAEKVPKVLAAPVLKSTNSSEAVYVSSVLGLFGLTACCKKLLLINVLR
jgi:hypothetical protein